MARILFIEDEESFSQLVKKTLERADHEVVAAANGEEGLRLARDAEFDLVITDLLMPEKDGLETIMALRKTPLSRRIIAISGGGRIDAHDYLNLARTLGANRTLRKPFSGEQLLDAVEATLQVEPSRSQRLN